MQNIALIVPSLKGGGAERVASLLSQELCEKYNLYLMVFDSEDIVYSYGGELVDINVKSHPNIFMKIMNVIKRTYKVKKAKKRYNIQYSISFMGSANIINILSRKKETVIISVHSHLSSKKNFFSSIKNALYNKSDAIIGVSRGVSNNLIDNYRLDKKKVDTIYNPIDIDEIQKLVAQESQINSTFNSNQFTIINMGRLTRPKGQWHLIRALSYVKKEIEDVKLLILGQGELKGYLKELVDKLDLRNNVEFLGYQRNPFKYIASSDLFVFSSLYEGFGNVLVEAMACGVPIISTDCRSGPREILAPETNLEVETSSIEYCDYGVLVPVCDGNYYDYDIPLTKEEKLLAKGIIELYKDAKLREHYSQKGLERVKDFNISSITEEWESLFQ